MSLYNHVLFDPTALDEVRELEADGEANLLDDILNNYKSESQKLMSDLKTFLSEGKRQDAERTAHSLKSSSRLVGAMRLSVAMAEIEEFARDNKLDECRSRVDEASRILQETLPVITR